MKFFKAITVKIIVVILCGSVSASPPESLFSSILAPILAPVIPYVNGLLTITGLQLGGTTLIPDLNYVLQPISNLVIASLTLSTFNASTDIYFLLYTQNNPIVGEIITFDARRISNSNFNASNPTRFIIHGWTNDHTSPVNTEITAGYLARGAFNIIVVDWGKGSKTNYIQSMKAVGDVGAFVAKFIDFLFKNSFVTYENIVVIGHSMGAHCAGFTGKHVLHGRINTIIGLDPAGPLFNVNDPSTRIAVGDATYVEIIHTNVRMLGLNGKIGDADFSPNNGFVQPGCEPDATGLCSHCRAFSFYAESLKAQNAYAAVKCSSYAQTENQKCQNIKTETVFKMGGDPPNSNLNGVFFLNVNLVSPYAPYTG